jgi:MFS family permease
MDLRVTEPLADPALEATQGPAAQAKPRVALVAPEGRAIASLGAIYASRMLGLFLVLPVLALYVRGLPDSSPWLFGLAMGAYGLTQACLQIPFGRWSDRFGRKPVIAVGLLLYALGSAVGALASTTLGVFLARLVQGMGAVSGPVMALLADLTRPEVRTRAMAVIGISIGASFIVSLVGAPVLAGLVGVPGMFWLMGALALVALVLLLIAVPMPKAQAVPPARLALAKLFIPSLAPYYLGIFVLHFLLQATFAAVPIALKDALALPLARQWMVYLTVFACSLPGTAALIVSGERRQHHERLAVLLLALAQLALAFGYARYASLGLALTVFFTAFNYLEARYPAGLSQAAGPALRGTALGIFSTAQFLGSFAGGFSGGVLVLKAGPAAVFGLASAGAFLWLVLARGTKSPEG